MGLEDRLDNLPDGERRKRQAEDEHARRLHGLANAASELGERIKQDIIAGPIEGIPAAPAIAEALKRLKLQHEALDGLFTRVTGRYLPLGADIYDWPAEGRHFNYFPLTPDELARDTYPHGKLMEGVIHFRADTGNGPLRYRAAYYSRGILLETDTHAEFGDFVHVLNTLKERHGISDHEDLSGDSNGIRAEIPFALPITTQFLEYARTIYGALPFEPGDIRAIYTGITRDEFERAALPREKIVKSW